MKKEYKNILIIRLSGVGDVIDTLPLLSALRSRFRESRISWLVSRKAKAVLEGNPLLDELIIFERARMGSTFMPLVAGLRKRKFDIVIDPQSQVRSGLLAFLSGAPVRLGFVKGISKEPNYIFMNERVLPLPEEKHNVERDLSFARYLGIPVEKKEFVLQLNDSDRNYAENFIKSLGTENSRLVGLVIAGSLKNRKWPVDKWARLANHLGREKAVRPVILWGPGEEAEAGKIAGDSGKNVLLAPATTLKQLAAFMEKCSLVISNNSGPMHMSVAVGTPTIGLHGPSDPEVTGAYGNRNVAALQNGLEGLGCYHAEKKRLRCTLFRNCDKKDCMGLVSVKMVLDEAMEILEISKGRQR